MSMRLIFNHLLVRILNLASERLVLLAYQRNIISEWAKADANDKSRRVNEARRIIDDLLRNRDYVHSVLEALEESRPRALTDEQESMVSVIRKMFRWSLSEYKSIVEYAREVTFDESILEELQKETEAADGGT